MLSERRQRVLVVGAGVSAAALALELARVRRLSVMVTDPTSPATGNTPVAGAAVWTAPDDPDRPRRGLMGDAALTFLRGFSPEECIRADVTRGTASAELPSGRWRVSDDVYLVSPSGLTEVLRERGARMGVQPLDGPVSQFDGRVVWATGADLRRHPLAIGEHLRYLHARIGDAAAVDHRLEISYRRGVYFAQHGHRVVCGLFAREAVSADAGLLLEEACAALPTACSHVTWSEPAAWPEVYTDAGFPQLRPAGHDWTYRGGCGSGVRYAVGAARIAARQLSERQGGMDD